MNEQKKQEKLLKALVTFFQQEESVLAIITTGSLVERPQAVDEWSDIDLRLVVEDAVICPLLDTHTWTPNIGQLIGLERFERQNGITLRICLENDQRIDLSFLSGNVPIEMKSHEKIIWQREDFSAEIVLQPSDTMCPFEFDDKKIQEKVDALWFQASVAVAKAARRDDLIAYHLTLEVMQGVLELQMIRRDAALKTNVHRFGGWGNDLVTRLIPAEENDGSIDILQTLQDACSLLDEIVPAMLEEYSPRLLLLLPSIEKARKEV